MEGGRGVRFSQFGQLTSVTKSIEIPSLFVSLGWYYERMKSNPKPSAEYTNFENAMRVLIRVPKSDVNRDTDRRESRKRGKAEARP